MTDFSYFMMLSVKLINLMVSYFVMKVWIYYLLNG